MRMGRRDGSRSTLGDWNLMAVSVDHLDVRLFQPGHWLQVYFQSAWHSMTSSHCSQQLLEKKSRTDAFTKHLEPTFWAGSSGRRLSNPSR